VEDNSRLLEERLNKQAPAEVKVSRQGPVHVLHKCRATFLEITETKTIAGKKMRENILLAGI
jgi:hypothetical protein